MSELGETPTYSPEMDRRIWEKAAALRDLGILDFSGVKPTYGNVLHEFEKHQDFIEADNHTHPDYPPIAGTITDEERQALSVLRSIFPSDEDRIWRASQTSI